MTLLLWVPVGSLGVNRFTRNIMDLKPSTYYLLTVKPVRDGPGGEGFAMKSVSFFTHAQLSTSLPIQSTTLKPTTDKQSTTMKTTTGKLPMHSTVTKTTTEKLAPPKTTLSANMEPLSHSSNMTTTPTVKVSRGKY